MDEYIGTIKAFGFSFPPRGWALCQGQTLSIAQNTALFSLLGTTYGGDGQTTFALPNLQGRTAIGQGQLSGGQNYAIGQISGTETATLNGSNLPAHTHTATSLLYAEGADGTSPGPQGKLLGSTDTNIYVNPTTDPNSQLASEAIVTTIAPAGGNQPFSILGPYLTINYSICLQGIFPSRN